MTELRNMAKDLIRGAVNSVARETIQQFVTEAVTKQTVALTQGVIKEIVLSAVKKNQINLSDEVLKAINSIITTKVQDELYWKAGGSRG